MTVRRDKMQRAFSDAAAEYHQRAQFQHRQTARLLDVAATLLPTGAAIAAPIATPITLLDIGCGTGFFAELARQKCFTWNMVGVDIAEGMCGVAANFCSPVQADALHLPLAENAVDAVVSSLCLQWVDDLPRAFSEIYRVLKPGGVAILGSLGTETLRELREAATTAHLALGLLPMRDEAAYRAAIHASGLEISLLQRDVVLEYYPNVFALMDSMRRIGAGNHMEQASPAPGAAAGVTRWKSMLAAYETHRTERGLPSSWDRLLMVLRKPPLEQRL
jgi:malonyl-CoA O-methyltransferase